MQFVKLPLQKAARPCSEWTRVKQSTMPLYRATSPDLILGFASWVWMMSFTRSMGAVQVLAIVPERPPRRKSFAIDFALGGTSGAISKTLTAPIERVKLIIQTQDANPKIRSGEVQRYTGIGNCFSRVYSEQGLKAFWRGNFTNVIRYFPTQAFNLAFKDTIKKMFPKYSPKTEFWQFFAVNLASGGAAGAGSLSIVYPLDYARTRLASDVGSGKKTFNGLGDCIAKTAKGPKGVMGLYNGFGVSVAGIIAYRGVQFGTFDTICGMNPYKNDLGMMGVVSTFGAAQTAVLASALVTYPFDTVRRRLQMESEKKPEDRIYKGTLNCVQVVAKEEGPQALYKGFAANALRTVGAALVLVLYDTSKKNLGL
jgi:solute carrier family 25 (adenine nucleotide translocator) protein 4/5/6/31